MTKTITLKEYVINAMIEELNNMEGQNVYGGDLGYKIFESANVDGSYTCSTYESKQWIKEYWDDLGEVVEEINFSIGEGSVPNVFDRPEAFQVVIMLELSSQLCGACKTIDKNWNNEFELTKRVIKNIITELKEKIN